MACSSFSATSTALILFRIPVVFACDGFLVFAVRHLDLAIELVGECETLLLRDGQSSARLSTLLPRKTGKSAGLLHVIFGRKCGYAIPHSLIVNLNFIVSGLNWSRRGMCFVSPVARQMTSNTVVAKRDVCKCVLLASQFKSSELLWLNYLLTSGPFSFRNVVNLIKERTQG